MTKTITANREPRNKFKIVCHNCGEEICKSSELNDLFARFLELASRHNLDSMDENLCEDAKEDLSLDNLRSGFSSRSFDIQMATHYELEGEKHESTDEVFRIDE